MSNENFLRNATGTRDLKPNDVEIREHIFNTVKKCFAKRGAVQIDTPVLELYGLVKNLYGEEFDKLVYTLKDGGAHELLLRYDLTVPLARYIAMNGIKFLRRYQIGKVYRRDDPQIEKGRYREFYQCDFDIIGDDQNTNIFDIEIFDTLVEILNSLIGEKYIIKISDRNILYELLNNFGINENINSVCATLDKLDKKDWNELCEELRKKNLTEDKIINIGNLINKIKEFNKISNNEEQINKVLNYLDEMNINNKCIKNIIFNLKQLGLLKYIQFDLSLARGLDYYTGIIFEVKYTDENIISSTISSGGRYDNIIGKLSNQGNVPAIGMSLGIERIATILEKTQNSNNINKTNIQVYVASIGENMITERIKLCCELRRLNFICSMSYLRNPKMRSQFDEVFSQNIPFMVIIGEDEISNNNITIKDINQNKQYKFNKNEGIKFLLKNINLNISHI